MSRFGSGPIFEAAGGTQAQSGKGPKPAPSRYCRGRKLAVAGRSEEGARQGQAQEQIQARPAHQEDRRGRAPDRGMEARARQVDIRHPAQDSAPPRRHAAAQGRNALGLPDMRHADSRHSGTAHARTRLASEGAKLEPRRRPEVPQSGEGAHGLDGVGCPHDGHRTTKTAGSSSIHQKAAVRG